MTVHYGHRDTIHRNRPVLYSFDKQEEKIPDRGSAISIINGSSPTGSRRIQAEDPPYGRGATGLRPDQHAARPHRGRPGARP